MITESDFDSSSQSIDEDKYYDVQYKLMLETQIFEFSHKTNKGIVYDCISIERKEVKFSLRQKLELVYQILR